MSKLPRNIARVKAQLEKDGYVLERDYIAAICAQWNVQPDAVKRALRRGAGHRLLKYRIRTEPSRLKREYLFVDPVSARKWLAFALDRIVVERGD